MFRLSLLFLLLATGLRLSAQQGGNSESRKPAASTVPVRGESRAGAPPGEAPESHLLDECGLFSPEQRELISKELISASSATGMNIYAVTMTFMTDGSCEQHARRLATGWATPDRPCAVALFEQATNEIQYSVRFGQVTPEEDRTNAEMWKAVTRFADACKSAEPRSARVARVAAAFRGMAQGIASYRATGAVPDSPPPAVEEQPGRTSSPATSGTGSSSSLPAIPDNFLADAAGILSPEAVASLTGALRRFAAAGQAKVYVVTLTWAPRPAVMDNAGKELESGAQATATELLKTWMPDSDGAVIVHEQATGKLGIASVTDETKWLTVPDMQKALSAARKAHEGMVATSPAEAVTICAMELISSFVAEAPDPAAASVAPASRSHVLVLQYVGAALCLICGVIYLLQRRHTRRRFSGRARFFPEVTVGMRMGAPMGGGVVQSSE